MTRAADAKPAPDQPEAAYATPMSPLFATQLTAPATVALAVFALPAAILATLAFRKQVQEVRVVEQNASSSEAQPDGHSLATANRS